MQTSATVGFMLLAVVTTASANQWNQIASWSNEAIFIDESTIRRAGDVVNVWVRVVYPRPTLHGGFLIATLDQRVNIHCSPYRTSVSSVIGYSRDGTVVERIQGGPGPSTDIPPDSDIALVADRVCHY
ncbi:surface-adhesin E family protein [Burkholderia stagnalis]|uniref:surface-adhesin E family protein n=1 Tax=Burkholderia stagnalis TaxID=1503054 RepID=UPI000F584007|nr:surface-adhesin E family protein [Burkholderia stagnalis]